MLSLNYFTKKFEKHSTNLEEFANTINDNVEKPINGVTALTYDILSYGIDVVLPEKNPGHLIITFSSSKII